MIKFNKNNVKLILSFILSGIVFTTVGAYAASSLSSINVLYSNSNSGLSSENVQDAIDELYTTVENSASYKKVCKLIGGNLGEVSSKYECDPGDGIKRNFYVLAVNNDNTIDLIMENNISDTVGTARTMSWNDAMEFFRTGAGKDIPSAWTNVMNIDLPKAQAIADATGYNWVAANSGATWWCLGSKAQDKQSDPYCTNSNQGKYAWLFNHLLICKPSGCTDDSGATTSGYWTRDLISNTANAWLVSRLGCLDNATVSISTTPGVRPVITVLKSNLYKL